MSMGILFPSIIINDNIFLSKTLNFSRTLAPTKFRLSSLQFSDSETNSFKQNSVQFDQNLNLKRGLFEKLKHKESDPVRILEEDDDWSKELFWAVVGFLNQTSRSNHILQVFDKWISKDELRVNVFNYERIVRLLVEEGVVEDAVMAVKKMKDVYGVRVSSGIYDTIVCGFIEKGRLEDGLVYLKEMNDIGMTPCTSTYNVLIKAYAKNGLYDDMAKCVKRMESVGCLPDQSTYNLLIREFSLAGLIKRMERTFRIVNSKKMDLEASTIVAMLEAYANFGSVEKMEKVYRRVLRLKPKVYLNDDLVRKVAVVYIENYMFSKLDEIGINLYTKSGNTNLAWCIRMLGQACILSRTGMETVAREMDFKKVKWSVTITNTMLLAYAKMKDFKHFEVVLTEMVDRNVKPDIVTCGILFDAYGFRFDEVGELGSWKKIGFFGDVVEFKTDPLVLFAFGKGEFLRSVEELDLSKSKVRTYESLIELVNQHQHVNRKI